MIRQAAGWWYLIASGVGVNHSLHRSIHVEVDKSPGLVNQAVGWYGIRSVGPPARVSACKSVACYGFTCRCA